MPNREFQRLSVSSQGLLTWSDTGLLTRGHKHAVPKGQLMMPDVAAPGRQPSAPGRPNLSAGPGKVISKQRLKAGSIPTFPLPYIMLVLPMFSFSRVLGSDSLLEDPGCSTHSPPARLMNTSSSKRLLKSRPLQDLLQRGATHHYQSTRQSCPQGDGPVRWHSEPTLALGLNASSRLMGIIELLSELSL